MEGVKLSTGSGRKRRVPNRLISDDVKQPIKSKKRKSRQVHSNGDLSLANVTTPKGRKKVPESQLASDHDFLSPPEGDLVVVLALSADQTGEKKVGRSSASTSTKTSKGKKKLELAGENKEACVDLQDCLPLSDMLHEPKRKKRSKRGNRSVVESGTEGLVDGSSNPNPVGEKSDQIDGKASATDQIIAAVNPEVVTNTSSDVASKIKKKKRSNRENELTLKNGIDNFPSTSVNNSSDVLPDNKSSEEAPSQIKKKRHSIREDAPMLKNEIDNLPNTSVNDSSDVPPNNKSSEDVPSKTKKKRRSIREGEPMLKNGVDDLPNTVVNNSSEVIPNNKSSEDVPSKIKKKRRSIREDEPMLKKGVDDLPNTVVNNSSEVMPSNKSSEGVPSKIKKKTRSINEPMLKNGIANLPNTLVNSSSDDRPSEEIHASSVPAEVGHRIEDGTPLQNQEVPIKKRRRSGQSKKLGLESEASKLPNTLLNVHSDQDFVEEKSNVLDVNNSTSLEVFHKVDDAVSKLQNQEAPVTRSSEVACSTENKQEEVNMVESATKKKKRSGQDKKFTLESGTPKALVNNIVDQNLKEEKSNLSDAKISTSLIAAKVSYKADADTPELQNQEAPVNKSSEAASITADERGELHMVQSEVKKKRRSGQGKKLVLAGQANTVDGKIATARLADEVSHKVYDTCKLQNQDAPLNKSSEAAPRTVDKHVEVDMVPSDVKKKTRSVRGKKLMSDCERDPLSNTLVGNQLDQQVITEKSDILDKEITLTSPITGSEADHKVDSVTLCEVQNGELGVSKGLDAVSEISNTEEEARETRKKRKRKEKKHEQEERKPTSHQVTASDGFSSLDVSAECLDSSFDQENITSSSNKCSLKDMTSTGDVRSDDKVAAVLNFNQPTGRNEKKLQKEKTNSTSHEAKVPEVSSSLDISAEHPDLSFGKEVAASLIKSPGKEVASTVGDVRSDELLIESQTVDDSLLKRAAFQERADIPQSPKKLLILDLNGLLVDIVPFLPNGGNVDKWVSGKALLKRPFCDDFLNFCFEKFNVAVWSSRTKKNVDIVVNFIMGDKRRNLLFCWDQSHCTKTGFPTVENDDKMIVLKELRKVWNKGKPDLPWERGEYNESNTLLLDDSPYKALLNPPHTAIFPRSYECRYKNDNELGPDGSLRIYLENLATAENVQKYVEQNPFGQRAVTPKNPSWKYYMNMMQVNRLRMPT